MFVWHISVFLLGLIVGSFLNVVIYRLKNGESAFQGRSHCPLCKHTLAWQDLIPLVSFVLLRGKCRYCGGRISLQYPFVELATSLIFLLIFNEFFLPAGGFQTLYLFIIASLLIVLFVYDLRHYILPDKILFPAIGLALFWNLFALNELANPLAAGVIASAFFFAIFVLSKGRAMGFGDVKLALFMGLFLGWPNILVALLFAFVAGAILGIGFILLRQKGWRSEIPFGPFLIAGTFVAFLWGKELVDWYLRMSLFGV